MNWHFPRRIHLVGIGGAGMSGLAELLQRYGHEVTGSDRSRSAATERLERIGIRVQEGHEPTLIAFANLVIYSSAIRADNPERRYAADHGIEQVRRAEALSEVMRTHTAICIAGTHGKTTTTSLVGSIMCAADMRPTVLVGGTLRVEDAPVIVGDGRIMVAEADEYDRSFLAMYPAVALVTNIEADHLDCYKDLEDIKNAFVNFCGRVPFYGVVVCCADDPGVRSILPRLRTPTVTYGMGIDADYHAGQVEVTAGRQRFTLYARGAEVGVITLSIPGAHNIQNALGAAAVAFEMGVPFDTIRGALESFRGVRRRFDVVGKARGITVVDDYAHHPTEISAALEAARQGNQGRVIAVFQPHLYSRTRDFLNEFAASLERADTVFVTDIYRAREEPIEGVSATAIVERLLAVGHRDARYVADKERIAAVLLELATPGDVILFMGAGDITHTAHTLARELHDE